MPRLPKILIVFALLGGAVALVVTFMGSLTAGIAAGLAAWLVCLLGLRWSLKNQGEPDADRRRLLTMFGLGGLAWVAGGTALGRIASKLDRPAGLATQETMATDLGAEYMELVRRTYMPGRAGDLQLLLAPFNSSNYPQESVSLVPNDPRTSHASVWMYLERVPILVYGPGIVGNGDSGDRVTLADLAPTTASLIGFDGWPDDREGRPLPHLRPTGKKPKVIVTFVIDGGGWNVLRHWSTAWPNLQGLMREGMLYRNAITGSFPAVTACAHGNIGTGTFPRQHGVTGHNLRDATGEVRKAYGTPGQADPSDILVPTLADLWHDATGAWVGEIGYQVWHLGMLGRGGSNRTPEDLPVAVFWDEDGTRQWQPHNPSRYRLPSFTPGLETLALYQSQFTAPDWDQEFTPLGRQSPCCSPPIIKYQGDVIVGTLDSEPIGQDDAPSLLYINFKSPDYTGHIYNMLSQWEDLVIREVDAQLARLKGELDARFPGEYVLIVTADHGQCPLPDAVDGVRLDPIQLQRVIEDEFGGLNDVVQSVVPSEVYLYPDQLKDAGATVDDVAAFLGDLTYRQTIGPYVPRDAIEQDMLDHAEFAGVFGTSYLSSLADADLSGLGDTAYTDDGVDPGVPSREDLGLE